MARITLLPLIVGVVVAGTVSVGCTQRLPYSTGVGGNLVRVKGDPADGTAIYVPIDQVEEYRRAEKAKSDTAPVAAKE